MFFPCYPKPKAGEFAAELFAFQFGYVFKQFWRYGYGLR